MILDGVMVNGNKRLSGLGHLEKSGSGEQMVYTYDELRSLGLLAAQALD